VKAQISLFEEDRQNGLRAFFNTDLARVDNELFGGFKKVLNDNIEIFANGLIGYCAKNKNAGRPASKRYWRI
jgi:hypothetical protein